MSKRRKLKSGRGDEDEEDDDMIVIDDDDDDYTPASANRRTARRSGADSDDDFVIEPRSHTRTRKSRTNVKKEGVSVKHEEEKNIEGEEYDEDVYVDVLDDTEDKLGETNPTRLIELEEGWH